MKIPITEIDNKDIQLENGIYRNDNSILNEFQQMEHLKGKMIQYIRQ